MARATDSTCGNDEYARCSLAGLDAIVRVADERIHVMGENKAVICYGPFEKFGIGHPRKTGVVSKQNLGTGRASQ